MAFFVDILKHASSVSALGSNPNIVSSPVRSMSVLCTSEVSLPRHLKT